MKTPIQILMVSALMLAAPLANASIYTGSWNNTTFGSTGALTLDLTVKKSKVIGSFDLDGPVFGAGDPAAIPFNLPRKADGSGSLKLNGTPLGDLSVSFKSNGKLTVVITNIPGGFLTEGRIDGKFDLKLEKFKATYEIDNASGLFAEGVAEAHVHKAPKIQVDGTVPVNGKVGEVTAKVLTNTKITSFTAQANGGAKITVKGKNPYHISVRNMTLPTTRVTLAATNADDFKTTKVVKFVKKNPAALLLE